MTSLCVLFSGKNMSSPLLFLGDVIFIPSHPQNELAEVREEGREIGQDRYDLMAGFYFLTKITLA